MASKKYLDNDGLLYLWQKIKNKFVAQESGKGLSTNDYTTAEKNKLAGIASGAEVNQNAFSNVKVGSTTVQADAKTDTLELVAGSNVTLTPDATNDKVTIAATDTVIDPATETPIVAGTGAVGTSVKYAREDHVHPKQTSVTGNAGTASKLSNARFIDGMPFDGSANITHFEICNTAGNTAAKAVTHSGWGGNSLAAGMWIAIMFANDNTATGDITLNVNNTGAKAIYYKGSRLTRNNEGAYVFKANVVHLFVYDGTQYQLVGGDIINPSTMTQAQATAGTDTTGKLITAKILSNTIDDKISAAAVGAATFKGTVNTGTDISSLTAYSAGWYWVVATAGTYVGETCEVGDMIFCVSDYSSAYSASDFSVVQNNLDLVAITNAEIDTIVAS